MLSVISETGKFFFKTPYLWERWLLISKFLDIQQEDKEYLCGASAKPVSVAAKVC